MKTLIEEFKEFALKGSVLDMGIGIVVGSAFTSIVNSFVKDILNPVLGLLTGGVDFSNLYISLSSEPKPTFSEALTVGEPMLTYGLFLNSIISFALVSLSLFLVIRSINNLKRNQLLGLATERSKDSKSGHSTSGSTSSPTPHEQSAESSEELLRQIRDLLAQASQREAKIQGNSSSPK